MTNLQIKETRHSLHKVNGCLVRLPNVDTILEHYYFAAKKLRRSRIRPLCNHQDIETLCLKRDSSKYLYEHCLDQGNVSDDYPKGLPETLTELINGGKMLWNNQPYFQQKWDKILQENCFKSNLLFQYNPFTKTGYSSSCDLIYLDQNAQFVLVEFVSSQDILSINYPPKGLAATDLQMAKRLTMGMIAMKRIRTKIAARVIAAEQTLGIKIHISRVVAFTKAPEKQVQIFSIYRKELEYDKNCWMSLLKEYIRRNPIIITSCR